MERTLRAEALEALYRHRKDPDPKPCLCEQCAKARAALAEKDGGAK